MKRRLMFGAPILAIFKPVKNNRLFRKIFYITIADNNWVPSAVDLQKYKELFIQADMDPLGAMIVNRNYK